MNMHIRVCKEQGREESCEAWPMVAAIMQSRKIPGESSTVRFEKEGGGMTGK